MGLGVCKRRIIKWVWGFGPGEWVPITFFPALQEDTAYNISSMLVPFLFEPHHIPWELGRAGTLALFYRGRNESSILVMSLGYVGSNPCSASNLLCDL